MPFERAYSSLQIGAPSPVAHYGLKIMKPTNLFYTSQTLKTKLNLNQYIGPLTILVFSLIAYTFNNQISETLVYDRVSVNNGEWWRIFSAPFIHTNSFHFLLNAIGVLILYGLHGHFYTIKLYFITFFFSGLTSSLGVHFYSTHLDKYMGLSAVLHGLFIVGVIQEIKYKEKWGKLLLLGVILKLCYEQFFGAGSIVAGFINAQIAVNAHLWGSIGGTIIALFYLYRHKTTPISN